MGAGCSADGLEITVVPRARRRGNEAMTFVVTTGLASFGFRRRLWTAGPAKERSLVWAGCAAGSLGSRASLPMPPLMVKKG